MSATRSTVEKTPPAIEPLLTTAEVAARLRCKRDAVRGYRAAGMPHVPMQGATRPRCLYYWSEVQAWLEAKRVARVVAPAGQWGTGADAGPPSGSGSGSAADFKARMKAMRRAAQG